VQTGAAVLVFWTFSCLVITESPRYQKGEEMTQNVALAIVTSTSNFQARQCRAKTLGMGCSNKLEVPLANYERRPCGKGTSATPRLPCGSVVRRSIFPLQFPSQGSDFDLLGTWEQWFWYLVRLVPKYIAVQCPPLRMLRALRNKRCTCGVVSKAKE
jgi:hypothetical protein